MRLPHGIIFQGGTSTGRQITDNCDIVDPANAGKFGDRSPLVESLLRCRRHRQHRRRPLSACHVEQAWLTQLKFLGSYTVPKIDVQLGASYQNIPGIELRANYADSIATSPDRCQGGLGRRRRSDNLGRDDDPFDHRAAIRTTTTGSISSISGSARFSDTAGPGRTSASTSTTCSTSGRSPAPASRTRTWLAPSSVIAPRLMKVSVTFDF